MSFLGAAVTTFGGADGPAGPQHSTDVDDDDDDISAPPGVAATDELSETIDMLCMYGDRSDTLPPPVPAPYMARGGGGASPPHGDGPLLHDAGMCCGG
jgi:hypothetical protein